MGTPAEQLCGSAHARIGLLRLENSRSNKATSLAVELGSHIRSSLDFQDTDYSRTMHRKASDVSASSPGRQAGRPTEFILAEALRAKLPPLITRGEDWFVYQNGIWQKRAAHHYRPLALALIPGERLLSDAIVSGKYSDPAKVAEFASGSASSPVSSFWLGKGFSG
jgi:hypothetical protein